MNKYILKLLMILVITVIFPFSSVFAEEILDDGEDGYSDEQVVYVGDSTGVVDGVNVRYLVKDPEIAAIRQRFRDDPIGEVVFLKEGKTIVSYIFPDGWKQEDFTVKRSNTLFIVKPASENPNKPAEDTAEESSPYNIVLEAIPSNYAEVVLRLVNKERAKAGARPLVLDYELMRGSAVRAEELFSNFSHTRPNGQSCFTVLRVEPNSVGENVAGGQGSCESVVQSWMNSPGHRSNILNPEFRKLGVGYYRNDNGEYIHYWVQMFGS